MQCFDLGSVVLVVLCALCLGLGQLAQVFTLLAGCSVAIVALVDQTGTNKSAGHATVHPHGANGMSAPLPRCHHRVP